MSPSRQIPSDPAKAKTLALIISAALLSGVVLFALFVLMQTPLDAVPEKGSVGALHEDPTALTFLVVAVVLHVGSMLVGRKMHETEGDAATRTRRAFRLHLTSLAMAEAVAITGLVLVLIKGTWEACLPFAIGFATMIACFVRALVAFDRIAEEAPRAAFDARAGRP